MILVTEAQGNLTDKQVQEAGDLYHDETRTMVARRDLFDEHSITSQRQHVRVKLSRHRGALGMDKTRISKTDKRTHMFSLESSKSKARRAQKLQVGRMMKSKLKEVAGMMANLKAEDDAAEAERTAERFRQGV